MPDRDRINGLQTFDLSIHPTPSGRRSRIGESQPEDEPAADTKHYVAVGRRNSRLRRLDSRGSANK
jgi:hypothetical protein